MSCYPEAGQALDVPRLKIKGLSLLMIWEQMVPGNQLKYKGVIKFPQKPLESLKRDQYWDPSVKELALIGSASWAHNMCSVSCFCKSPFSEPVVLSVK